MTTRVEYGIHVIKNPEVASLGKTLTRVGKGTPVRRPPASSPRTTLAARVQCW